MNIFDDIYKVLDFIDSNIEYPEIRTIDGSPSGTQVIVNGENKLMFCSNNYLSVSSDDRVKNAVIEGVKKYGMGSGGSRLVSGNTNIQEELENNIANFKKTDKAITFSTGYMANLGTIPSLLKIPDLSTFGYLKNHSLFKDRIAIFSDELNHASIIDGSVLSKAEKVVYRHCNTEDLEKKLKARKKYRKKLIVTDGVFSMDGDIAPLPNILSLAKKYEAMVMIDDAHSTGILGKEGGGTLEYFGILNKDLDTDTVLSMGTFTKSFGGVGGFVVGTDSLIKYLRVTARTYMFTAPIPPAIAMGINKAIDIVRHEPERREKLMKNAQYLRNKLTNEGFNILNSETQIVPILIGDEGNAIRVSRELFNSGIILSTIRWPAVPRDSARLRITLMSDHTLEQMDELVSQLKNIREKIKF